MHRKIRTRPTKIAIKVEGLLFYSKKCIANLEHEDELMKLFQRYGTRSNDKERIFLFYVLPGQFVYLVFCITKVDIGLSFKKC